MEIKGRLIRLREATGLDQYELAKRAGMSPSQLNRYERGKSRPTLPTLERLARALRVRVSDLFW